MSKTHKFPIKNKNDEDITLNEFIKDLIKNINGNTINDAFTYISNNYPPEKIYITMRSKKTLINAARKGDKEAILWLRSVGIKF